MGLVSTAVRNVSTAVARVPNNPVSSSIQTWQNSRPQSGGNYNTFAREGYMTNSIIFSAIELRATSAAEPHVRGKRTVKDKEKRAIKQAVRNSLVTQDSPSMPGHQPSDLMIDYLIMGLEEKVTDHPAITLLERPNPFMSRFQFWATVFMHLDLAGNAYAWKGRPSPGAAPTELWLLRPDRVRVIPDRDLYIRGYEYRLGSAVIFIPADDIIHFKTRNPVDEFYGMPPLMPASGWMHIDNYMQHFVASYFRNNGVPSAVMAVKAQLGQEDKDEIRNRFRSQFTGDGLFDLMVIDQTEVTFTPLTATLGSRGLVMPELNQISESRNAMPFGVPLSILGTLTGQTQQSYAAAKADWQVFWDVTMTPAYVSLGDTLNLFLLPEWGDLDALFFDLSDVKALQEDKAAIQDRAMKNWDGGAASLEETRAILGLAPDPTDGHHFLVPSRGTLITAPFPDMVGAGALPGPDQPTPPPDPAPKIPAALMPAALVMITEVRCPACNKWCAKDKAEGEVIYCRKCKREFEAGGEMVAIHTVQRETRKLLKDADGNTTGVEVEITR